MTIEERVGEATAQIEASHAARERAIGRSRALIRQCANAIRAAHRREFDAARAQLGEATVTAQTLRNELAGHPELLFAGYTQDALKEYAEAALVYAFLHGEEPPSAATLGVEPAAYLNGLAEAASELRRAILDGLDDVYGLLVTVDYPDAVTGGLRRTTDALRAVLERTRGDVTAAIRQDQLTAALAAFEGTLKR
jgi:translin